MSPGASPPGEETSIVRARPFRDPLWITTAALAVVAALLRLWHIGHGLPDFDEEAFVFRKALELWGPAGQGTSLNPHSFTYPSLTIYLQLALQKAQYALSGLSRPADYLLAFLIDPTGPVLLARTPGVFADVVTVVLASRIGRRFGATAAVVAATLVTFAPFMVRASRQIYCDPIMAALSMVAIDRMLSYLDRGGPRRLAVAAAAIGLATGAKYPAALLVIPLALVIWDIENGIRARVAELSKALALAGLAFLITTPYLIVGWTEFAKNASLLLDITEGGWLGKLAGGALPYSVVGLARNLGWIGLGLLTIALAGAAGMWRDRSLRVIAVCWIVFFVPAVLVRVEAERYLLGAIATGAILVGAACAEILERSARLPMGLPARLGFVALVLAPVVWSGVSAGSSGRSTTQLQARRWCEAHLGPTDLVLSEAYGPDLLGYDRMADMRSDPLFEAASPEVQARYLGQRAFHLAYLSLIVSGRMAVRVPVPGTPVVDVYPHAVDWNAAVYDARLLAGVDYVITTASVRGRFEQDPARFREQQRFYSLLDRAADEVAGFRGGRGVEGPGITVYRLGARARQAIAAAGPVDSLWWGRTVPDPFRRAIAKVLGSTAAMKQETMPPWAVILRSAFAERYAPFADALAWNLAELERWEPAERLSLATLRVLPEDVTAARIFTRAAGAIGRWPQVRQELEAGLAAVNRRGGDPQPLLLLEGEALAMTGDRELAQALLLGLLEHGSDESRSEAMRLLRRLSVPRR